MNLKTTITIFFIAGIFAGCTRSAQEMLAWRWNFTGIYVRSEKSFLDSINTSGDDDSEALLNFFRDYKLVLRNDNTFDLVLFKNYRHGDWKYSSESKLLSLKCTTPPAVTLQVLVDSISPITLALRLNQASMDALVPVAEQSSRGFSFFKNQGPYTFVLSADKDGPGGKDDPYNRDNNLWRIKPRQPETANQLEHRVEGHILFLRLLMQNVVDGKATYVSLHSFHTPLVITKDDIQLQHYEDIKDDWEQNFYDSTNAKRGYQLLNRAVIYNGVKPGTTNNRFINTVAMLDEVMEHLKKQ